MGGYTGGLHWGYTLSTLWATDFGSGIALCLGVYTGSLHWESTLGAYTGSINWESTLGLYTLGVYTGSLHWGSTLGVYTLGHGLRISDLESYLPVLDSRVWGSRAWNSRVWESRILIYGFRMWNRTYLSVSVEFGV